MRYPAVFFDRDGVLNEDFGYVYRAQDFVWKAGAIESIRSFKRKGYLLYVITNQSGVARGFYSEDDVRKLHMWMNDELQQIIGEKIDGFYYCPHHPFLGSSAYTCDCECRKPKPGLIEKALSNGRINLQESFLIGDKSTDLLAAKAIGMKGYLFQGENLFDFCKSIGVV